MRASGHEVESTVVGLPQPLPPELEIVAYRVLQEMLTNAIKHGRRDPPVTVERHWEGELRIEVRNVVAVTDDATQPLRAIESDATMPPATPPPVQRRARASTACAAGSRRWAVGSTYAGATRRAGRRSPRRRGCP